MIVYSSHAYKEFPALYDIESLVSGSMHTGGRLFRRLLLFFLFRFFFFVFVFHPIRIGRHVETARQRSSCGYVIDTTRRTQQPLQTISSAFTSRFSCRLRGCVFYSSKVEMK